MTVVTEPCTPGRGVVVDVRVFTEAESTYSLRPIPPPPPHTQPEPPVCLQLAGLGTAKRHRDKADPEGSGPSF